MKDDVAPKTLNLSIYVGAILTFWALTLNKCIEFEHPIKFVICSDKKEIAVQPKDDNNKCIRDIEKAEGIEKVEDIESMKGIDIKIKKDENIINFLPIGIEEDSLT